MPHFGLGDKIGGNRFNQALENPLIDINDFAAPPAFAIGNAGRNIVTGPASYYSQVSAKKNFKFKERWNLQLRYAFQNPFHNYGFAAPTNTVDFRNPQNFGKVTGDPTTASFGGQPLMNLTLMIQF